MKLSLTVFTVLLLFALPLGAAERYFGEPVQLKGPARYFTSWKYVRQGSFSYQCQWEGDANPNAAIAPGETARPSTKDPLVWPDIVGANGGSIVYPGKDEVLASVRLARFRDGMDDYDYLTLLAEKQPNHPLLAEIRRRGAHAYATAQSIATYRKALSEALESRESPDTP
jgi:hypothetical protein